MALESLSSTTGPNAPLPVSVNRDILVAGIPAKLPYFLPDNPGSREIVGCVSEPIAERISAETASGQTPAMAGALDPARVLWAVKVLTAQLDACPPLETTAQFLLETLLHLLDAPAGVIATVASEQMRLLATHGFSPTAGDDLRPWIALALENGEAVLAAA